MLIFENMMPKNPHNVADDFFLKLAMNFWDLADNMRKLILRPYPGDQKEENDSFAKNSETFY